jgi:hypothetical protein
MASRRYLRRLAILVPGTMDAISFDADWQFAKKFDAYAGVVYSEVHNGLASGYPHPNNLAPTVGLRFRF